MATIEFQTQINAAPEEVFAYLSDLEKHPEWSHCMEIEKTSEGPVGVGASYRSKGKNFGITANETVEVTEHKPNDGFGWRTTGAMGMKFGWSFELSPQEGGTLLIERFEPPSGLMGSFISLTAGSSTRKAMEEGLGRIKEKLEGATGESPVQEQQESSGERQEESEESS
ncbi:MAG: SRPBCC family protein [Chloroflexi bacterium]|nr:SRPBCC family protein [Chloroflexota bacterium]